MFDDEHQGPGGRVRSGEVLSRPAPVRDAVAIIGAVWLVWVLGGTQLRLPRRARARAARGRSGAHYRPVSRARPAARGGGATHARAVLAGALRAAPRRGAADRRAALGVAGEHPRLARADVRHCGDWYVAAVAGTARSARATAQPHRSHRKAACRMSDVDPTAGRAPRARARARGDRRASLRCAHW